MPNISFEVDLTNRREIREIENMIRLREGLTINPDFPDRPRVPPLPDLDDYIRPRVPPLPDLDDYIRPRVPSLPDREEQIRRLRERFGNTSPRLPPEWEKIVSTINEYMLNFNMNISDKNYLEAWSWLYNFYRFMELYVKSYEHDILPRDASNSAPPPEDFDWQSFYSIDKTFALISTQREKLSVAIDKILLSIDGLKPEEQRKKWDIIAEFSNVVRQSVHSFVWIFEALSRYFRELQQFENALEAIRRGRLLCQQVEAGPVYEIINSWIITVGAVGDLHYLAMDKEKAQSTYGQIAKWTENGVQIGDALGSVSVVFNKPKADIEKIIEKINQLSSDPEVLRDIVQPDGNLLVGISLKAISSLKSIVSRQIALSGEIIGGNLRVTSVWRFETLFNMATYFANQAKLAEQRYISFQETLQQRQLTNRQLTDAVVLAKNELKLAEIRNDQARQGIRIAQQRTSIAERRAQQTVEQYNTYSSKSREAVEHQMYASALGGNSDAIYSDIMVHVNNLRTSGETRGPRGVLTGANTYIAGMASREVELQRLSHASELARKEQTLVKEQEEMARTEALYANVYASSVEDRVLSAKAMEEFYESQPLDEAVYVYMANTMKEISFGYLTIAFEAARMAERSFMFEYRTESELFSDSVTLGQSQKILESERLLQNLASLKSRELSLGDINQNILEWTIDLKALSPATFIDNLKQGSPFEFSLNKQDVSRRFPGLVDVRVEKLELDVITVGAGSTFENSWTLANGAVGSFVDSESLEVVERLQNSITHTYGYVQSQSKQITMMLSEGETQKRRPFEGIAPLCNWQLRISPVKNIDANTRATLRLFISGTFNEAQYSQDIEVVPERRLVPLALSQYDMEKLEELKTARSTTISIPFTVEADDIRYSLFEESDTRFPQLKSVAIVVKNEKGILEESFTIKVKPPMGEYLDLELEDGSGDVDVTEDWPAVGDYKLTLPASIAQDILDDIREILIVPSFVMSLYSR